MPFPSQPFQINGGCNCGAIRYKVDVSGAADRPIRQPVLKHEKVLPYTSICLCKDCRKASGSTIFHIFFATIESIAMCVAQQSEHAEAQWRQASEVLTQQHDEQSCLGIYASSEPCRRYFCKRCGTHLAYRAFDLDELDETAVVDILVGTVDGDLLDKDIWEPEYPMSKQECPAWLQAFVDRALFQETAQ